MRKYLLLIFLVSIETINAQSVIIEPGKQGFSNTNTPKGTLEMNGNGMLIQQKFRLTSENPASHAISMDCGTTLEDQTLSGILKDPNGDAAYLSGINYDCRFSIDLSSNPEVIGIRFIVEELNFGTGDGIYAFPLIYGSNQDPGQGDTVDIFSTFQSFNFTANGDNSIGTGFRIRWQALLVDDEANPLQNYKKGSNNFAIDIKKGIFRFGKMDVQDRLDANTLAIGNGAWTQGNGSIAIGGARATSSSNAIAIGNGAVSLGTNAVAIGQSTFAIGSNSFAVISGHSEASNSAVIGDSFSFANGSILLGTGNQSFSNATNSIGIGENIRLDHERTFALGRNLRTTGSHSVLLGAFNGSLASSVTPASPSSRIFELGNGTSSTETHNAITVLANGNTGLGIYQPTENLDVEKNARIRGNLIVNGNQTHGGDLTLASDKKITVQDIRGIGTDGLFLGNPTARIMQILGNGKVAFGTNSLLTPPTRDFEVTGSAQFKSSVEVNNDLTVSDLTKSNQMLVGDGLANFNATTKFHLRNGTSGSTTISSVHLARIENDDHAFLTFAVPSDKMAGIQFLKPGTTAFPDQFIGSIRLTESNNFDFRLGENSTRMRLNPQGDLQIGMGITANGCLKDGNGTILAGTCASDSRYKKNIQSFKPLLSEFVKLKPVHFDWKVDEFPNQGFGNEQSYGFIAQEIEKVFPDLVTTDKNGFKAVNYTKLNIMTIQAVKELKEENDQLKVVIASILKDIEILKLSSKSSESK